MVDDMLMIDPRFFSIMYGTMNLLTRNTPRTFTAITLSQSSTEVSCAVPTPLMPALLNSTSMRPSAGAVDVGDHDAGAFAREEGRTRASDPGAAAGNHADLVLKASAHSAVNPPSTGSATPVMKPAAGVARKSTTDAISAGVARRPSGCATESLRRKAAGSGIAS